jgi:hypothetical protein
LYILKELGSPYSLALTSLIFIEFSAQTGRIKNLLGEKYERNLKVVNLQIQLNRDAHKKNLEEWIELTEKFLTTLQSILEHPDNEIIYNSICSFYSNWILRLSFEKSNSHHFYPPFIKQLKKLTSLYDVKYGQNWSEALVIVFISDYFKPLSKNKTPIDETIISFFEVVVENLQNISSKKVQQHCLEQIFEIIFSFDLNNFTYLLKALSKIESQYHTRGIAKNALKYLSKRHFTEIPTSVILKNYTIEQLFFICSCLLKTRTTTAFFQTLTIHSDALKEGILITNKKDLFLLELTDVLAYWTSTCIEDKNVVDSSIIFKLWVQLEKQINHTVDLMQKNDDLKEKEKIFRLITNLLTSMSVVVQEPRQNIKLNMDHIILHYKIYEIITGVVKNSCKHFKTESILEITPKLGYILSCFLDNFSKYYVETSPEEMEKQFMIFIKNVNCSFSENQPISFWHFLISNLFEDTNAKSKPISEKKDNSNDTCELIIRPPYFCYIDFLKSAYIESPKQSPNQKIDNSFVFGPIKNIFNILVSTARNACPPRITKENAGKHSWVDLFEEVRKNNQNLYPNNNEAQVVQVEVGNNMLFIDMAKTFALKAKNAEMITEEEYQSWLKSLKNKK